MESNSRHAALPNSPTFLSSNHLLTSSLPSKKNSSEIRLWDLSQQSLIHRYPKAHSGIIQSLCVSPLSFSNSQDGGGARRLLSCSTDRTIKLWDADPFPSRSGWAGEAEDEDEEQEDENGMDMTSGGKLKKGGLLSSRDAEISKSEVSSKPNLS